MERRICEAIDSKFKHREFRYSFSDDFWCNWRDVVESCIDPQTWECEDDEMSLDTLSLRSRVYKEIIRPLELDLLEAFPDIPLEGLDELAQSLDLNNRERKGRG